MDSILTSVKKSLGIDSSYTHFDTDIILSINTVLSILSQLGVGPEQGYSITSDIEKWSDFLGARKDLESVKTFVYMKVKLIFDPPSNSFLIDSINKILSELEWRITNQAGKKGVE